LLSVLQAFQGDSTLTLLYLNTGVPVGTREAQRVSLGLIWLIPGICAIFGGIFSYLTYRLVVPPPASQSRPTEYRVISGRVTVSTPAAAEPATIREEHR